MENVQKIDFTHQHQNIKTLNIRQFADAMGLNVTHSARNLIVELNEMQAFVGSVKNAGVHVRYVSASSPKYSLLNLASAKTAHELSDACRQIKSRPQPMEGKLLIHYVEHVDGIEVVNGEVVNKRVSVVDVGAWLQSLKTKRPEGLRAITEFKDRVTSAFFMFDEDYSAHSLVMRTILKSQ